MTRLALACALACAASAAHADPLSWTFIEGAAYRLDTDAGDTHDGFAVRGSGAIDEHWHVFGALERVSIDGDWLDQKRAGVGANGALAKWLDVYGRVSYEKVTMDDLLDGDGFGVEAGVRALLSERFEVGASLRQQRIEADDRTSLRLEVHYAITPALGIGGEWLHNEDYATFSLGVTWRR